jgi:hypothetical protein
MPLALMAPSTPSAQVEGLPSVTDLWVSPRNTRRLGKVFFSDNGIHALPVHALRQNACQKEQSSALHMRDQEVVIRNSLSGFSWHSSPPPQVA